VFQALSSENRTCLRQHSCVSSKSGAKFHIADAFSASQIHSLALVCITEWKMKDYTLPSAVGFCSCWWRSGGRGGVLPKLWAPRCDFAARKIQFFPYTHLSMTSHLISHNLWKTSSQLHITFNNGGGWLTVNHVFGFLGIPTQ